MYIGIELPSEEEEYALKKERALKVNGSMEYIVEQSWYRMRHSYPQISRICFENEVKET